MLPDGGVFFDVHPEHFRAVLAHLAYGAPVVDTGARAAAAHLGVTISDTTTPTAMPTAVGEPQWEWKKGLRLDTFDESSVKDQLEKMRELIMASPAPPDRIAWMQARHDKLEAAYMESLLAAGEETIEKKKRKRAKKEGKAREAAEEEEAPAEPDQISHKKQKS
jgi:hypothetical protein